MLCSAEMSCIKGFVVGGIIIGGTSCGLVEQAIASELADVYIVDAKVSVLTLGTLSATCTPVQTGAIVTGFAVKLYV